MQCDLSEKNIAKNLTLKTKKFEKLTKIKLSGYIYLYISTNIWRKKFSIFFQLYAVWSFIKKILPKIKHLKLKSLKN